MSNLPRNKWISYGLALFIGFVFMFLFSFAMMDLSIDPTGTLVLKALGLLLPVASFGFCIYGLIKINKSKESGTSEAVAIVILLGVYGVLTIYNYLRLGGF